MLTPKMQIPAFRLPYSDKEVLELEQGLSAVLRSGVLTKGDWVKEFEELWAEYCGVTYAVACSSGTSALELIYRAIGVEGKSVVVPSNTFIGTVAGIIRAGGRVILADCESGTLQLSLKSAMDAVQGDTVAVVLVHIGGYVTPQLEQFTYWAEREGLVLIEDCAQAHGAEYQGRKVGSIGKAGAFSFFATKVLTTGEGGMVTTDDKEIYRKCISLRNQGRRVDDARVHETLGYNWRMDEVRGVLGVQQVRKADKVLEERRRIAGWYDEKLEKGRREYRIIHGVALGPQLGTTACNPAYYKYVVLTFDQQEVEEHMESRGIQMPGLVYEIPLHRQPAVQELWRQDKVIRAVDLGNTNWVSQHHLCLPLYLGMTEDEVDYVVESLEEALR